MNAIADNLRSITVTKYCAQCGTEFTAEILPWMADKMIHCETCRNAGAEAEEARIARELKHRREELWMQLIGEELAATDPSKLPDPSKLTRIMYWHFGAKGLILHGETGAGKSRCASLLLRREWESRRSISILSSLAGHTYAARYARGADVVEEWFNKILNADIVFMDDVFKSKLTESFEAFLFGVIEERTNRRKPIIITVNDSDATLAARMSNDRGPAILRRLKDFCDTITFD
jgi:hypothetical protein